MVEDCKDDDLVVLMNDDMVFGKDWLKILLEAFEKDTKIELAQSQEMNNPEKTDKAVTPMGYAGWFKKYVCWEYKHNYIDQEWTEVAKAMGSFLYVPESKIYHNHWSFGKSERDATYLEQMKDFEQDKDLYNERYALSNGFKNMENL
jgi:GT2 family glycosyltransferase